MSFKKPPCKEVVTLFPQKEQKPLFPARERHTAVPTSPAADVGTCVQGTSSKYRRHVTNGLLYQVASIYSVFIIIF